VGQDEPKTGARAGGRASNVLDRLARLAEHAAVERTVLVDRAGLLIAAVPCPDRALVDRLAAAVAGLRSLAQGAATAIGKGSLRQVIVDTDAGYLYVIVMPDAAVLGVQTDPTADLAEVGYQAVLATEQIRPLLNDAVVQELASLLPG
jgi:predicted regulator of Ras-like GTPase activity (Roadblock/LC7/MglB family)